MLEAKYIQKDKNIKVDEDMTSIYKNTEVDEDMTPTMIGSCFGEGKFSKGVHVKKEVQGKFNSNDQVQAQNNISSSPPWSSRAVCGRLDATPPTKSVFINDPHMVAKIISQSFHGARSTSK